MEATTEKVGFRPHLISTASHASSARSSNDSNTRQPRDQAKLVKPETLIDDVSAAHPRALLEHDSLKRDEHGIILDPQPTDDPQDPLNWSARKKCLMMVMLAVNSCTGDFTAASGATSVVVQATEWGLGTHIISHSLAGITFMLGVGGLFTVWFSAYFGRLPVLFWFQIMAAVTAAWAAAAASFNSFMAARILNGFFSVCAAGGGLMFINDMFFFHQRARMINVWSTAIIFSPFLGPQIMAAILSVANWRVGFWLDFGFIGFAFVLVVILGDETFYPRHLSRDLIPPRRSRIMRLVGVEQLRTKYTDNTFWGSGSRVYQTICKPPVFLTCLFYFFDFPWTIANNTTVSVFIIADYKFSYANLAAMYTAPVVGAIVGLLFGHFIFDFLSKLYAKYHDGRMEPEARLIVLWFILPIKVVGFNLIGITIQHHWDYYILAVGWGMHNFGTIVTTTAVGAYLIDAYPEASGECAAWLNASRVTGGFIIAYFQIKWATQKGTQYVYGVESAIMASAFVIVIFLQFFGRKLRARTGHLNFKTN